MSSLLSQPHTAGHGMCVSQAPLQPCGAAPVCGQCGALSPASLQRDKHVWSRSEVGQDCSGAIPWRPSGGEGGAEGSTPASSPAEMAEMLGHIPRPPDAPLPGADPPSLPSSPPGLTVSALSWDHLPGSYMFPRPYSGSVVVKATNFQVFNAMAVPAARGRP